MLGTDIYMNQTGGDRECKVGREQPGGGQVTLIVLLNVLGRDWQREQDCFVVDGH